MTRNARIALALLVVAIAVGCGPSGVPRGIVLVTLGTTRDRAPWPIWLPLGTPNLGGPITAASGLVFIGATTDFYLRAFSTETGDELWKTPSRPARTRRR